MNLLIDMGNSRVKWAVQRQDGLCIGQTLDNDQLEQSNLEQLWASLPVPQRIGVASVGTGSLLERVQAFANILWPTTPVLHLAAQANAFGVTNAYQQPEKLGVDRWLALIAAHRYYPTAVCVVDCGTAITVDLLATNGVHLGGYISPGLTLMKQALSKGTNALPFSVKQFPDRPADHTEAAIYNGTLLAASGLIEQVIRTSVNCGQLILTGGDAHIVAEKLTIPALIDADLVLRGLAIVMEETP